MKEKCGCEVSVDPKTQFETVRPCKKHDTWRKFEAWINKKGYRNLVKLLKKKK